MIKKITSIFASLIPLLYANSVLATAGGSNPQPLGSFQSAFKTIFAWVVALAGIIFVVMFLVGGIQYLTSAGNEEAAGKAKKLLIDAVIGIIVVAIAWAAGSWVLGQLGITDTGGVIQ